jgi:hypothetical protein
LNKNNESNKIINNNNDKNCNDKKISKIELELDVKHKKNINNISENNSKKSCFKE